MHKMSHIFSLACAGLFATSISFADVLEFDFNDPKKVNSITFLMDAPLESINGTANGIKGTVAFNPKDPASISGTIKLKTETITVPNDTMEDHIHGSKWMDTDKYEHIVFSAKELSKIETNGDTTKGHLLGDITIKGITKEITVPITITYLPGKLAARSNGAMKGDLLVLRSNFTVKRSDFNINAGNALDKVAEDIEIRLALAGASQEKMNKTASAGKRY